MNSTLIIFSWLLVFVGTLSTSSADQTNSDSLQIDVITTGLGVPWGMAVLPNNHMLITQREGKLTQLVLNTGETKTISGLPTDIFIGGQAGLFDVQLPPNYATSQWVYFSYSKNINGQGATTLSRAKLKGQTLDDWQDLLVTKSTSKTKAHFGGRITFDNSGHVFISVGERGVRPNAQNLSNHAGSILRLNLDGTVPSDNPFIHRKHALPEIWSYGHRNPQGLFFNHQTKQLWEIEHGPRGGDEINLIEAGKNYGWPIISYGMEYNRPFPVGKGTQRAGMEQPIKYYIPSIAPSSLIQYTGNTFSGWNRNLLAGALNLQHLNRIVLDNNNHVIKEEHLLYSLNDRIRNVIESPEGWLYIATDSGKIIRIKPTH